MCEAGVRQVGRSLAADTEDESRHREWIESVRAELAFVSKDPLRFGGNSRSLASSMALLNTLHTSEFRDAWRATLRSSHARSFARQSLRLLILLAFLLTGLFFLYLKAFRNASLEGVVNAPKYVVRAPIEGIFQLEGLAIGTPLAACAAIGTITNDRLDDRLEAELSTQVSRLMREMAAQEVVLNEIAAIRERLATRLDDLRAINIRKV